VVPERGRGVMAGISTANRSETVTVPTPGGQIEVVRQRWRSQRPGSRWNREWLACRAGQRDSRPREAIRQAVLLTPGKQPKWLLDAAARAGAELERP
jgi:hypothetical protein